MENNVGNGGGYTYVRPGSKWEFPVPSAQFCCEPKSALENKIFSEKDKYCMISLISGILTKKKKKKKTSLKKRSDLWLPEAEMGEEELEEGDQKIQTSLIRLGTRDVEYNMLTIAITV